MERKDNSGLESHRWFSSVYIGFWPSWISSSRFYSWEDLLEFRRPKLRTCHALYETCQWCLIGALIFWIGIGNRGDDFIPSVCFFSRITYPSILISTDSQFPFYYWRICCDFRWLKICRCYYYFHVSSTTIYMGHINGNWLINAPIS
jgi:hypothetical protein